MPEKDAPFELSLPKYVITGGPPTYTSQEPLTSSDEVGLKTGMSQLLKSLSTNLLPTLSTSNMETFLC